MPAALSVSEIGELVAKRSAGVAEAATRALGPDEGDAFWARWHRQAPHLIEALSVIHSDRHTLVALLDRLETVACRAAAERPTDLRRLDRRREIDPGWFQSPTMLGYATYVDRFAGDLAGVNQRLDHLADLGVTYLHLMSVLAARPGDNDGGYAISDYRQVEPELGTMAELAELAAEMRDRGMSLCIDVVLNHTAREHPWAQAARAGDPDKLAYYLTFADRRLPDAYEQTLPEIFPSLAPGNFTWEPELGRWVWTTFRDFQWDLDHTNPDVTVELAEVMCLLANQGVEVLRLDAAPFLWKRLGTDCQNQPEAHRLVQVFRAVVALAAPGVLCKAEAIVPPDELVQYLGAHPRRRDEAHLAYNNQLMVMGWNGLATRRAELMTHALERMSSPPSGTAWCTYVRCHDDIGWAVDDHDARASGFDPHQHRAFLAEFYRGDFPGSPARGEPFMATAAGDERTSGMSADLAGLSAAGDDPERIAVALARIRLLYALALGWGGIPLIWMGDEVALGGDRHYREHPDQAGDSRWLHRPVMDWDRVARARHDPDSIAGRAWSQLAELVSIRSATPALGASGPTRALWTDQASVFAWLHEHPGEGALLGLANMSEQACSVDPGVLWPLGGRGVDLLAGGELVEAEPIVMGPLAVRWLVEAD